MYRRNHLSHHDAQAIVAAIQAVLEREGKDAAVAVVDAQGELIAFLRTDHCPLPSINNAIHKAYTAARERKPSAAIGRASRSLAATEIRLTALSTWQSPSGATYPARWRLEVPGEELELELTPRVPNQELDVTVRYWEGAVKVNGTSRSHPIAGHGFVEMTGYAPPSPPAP